MEKPIIEIKDLTKRYKLKESVSYFTLRESLSGILRKRAEEKDFYALENISFDVHQGEVLGVVGANGAGKSTLLKVLSQITPPTGGQVKLRGRVASLLEVGTGFHPELTGRENIFLNGAILGMKRYEIKDRFAEIVDFSGISRFLDTPVKRYSSGMYVRLAFSVAAHLESEILLIDEVLSVGDAKFQEKSLNKMNAIAKGGRTVIFVSHNMGAVRSLCTSAVLLEKGRLKMHGGVNEIISAYFQSSTTDNSTKKINEIIKKVSKDKDVVLTGIAIKQHNLKTHNIFSDQNLNVDIHYKVKNKLSGFRIYVDLLDSEENLLVRTFHDDNQDMISKYTKGNYLASLSIPKNIMAPGKYILSFGAGVYDVRSVLEQPVRIPIEVMRGTDISKGYPDDTIRGKLWMKFDWNNKKLK